MTSDYLALVDVPANHQITVRVVRGLNALRRPVSCRRAQCLEKRSKDTLRIAASHKRLSTLSAKLAGTGASLAE